MPRSSCCDIVVFTPDTDGEEAECRDCSKTICTQCAAILETEDGYGEYGQDTRTKAICWTCYPVPASHEQLPSEEFARDVIADLAQFLSFQAEAK